MLRCSDIFITLNHDIRIAFHDAEMRGADFADFVMQRVRSAPTIVIRCIRRDRSNVHDGPGNAPIRGARCRARQGVRKNGNRFRVNGHCAVPRTALATLASLRGASRARRTGASRRYSTRRCLVIAP
jgi:hypothetical protein